jgi:hypothetical protein
MAMRFFHSFAPSVQLLLFSIQFLLPINVGRNENNAVTRGGVAETKGLNYIPAEKKIQLQ